jgi:hypothetical protein
MNFTLNGSYPSDNNLIQVRSSQLAQNYQVEFEEVFLDQQFGSASPANTLIIPSPQISTLYRDEFARVWGIAQKSLE